MTMEDHTESTAVFRAHATARLTGDAAEAARLASGFTESEQRLHMLFVQSLFAAVVIESLGSAPDPFDLAELAKRLHGRHFRPDAEGAPFVGIRAEAMIRSLFGEEFLLYEIPFREQPGYMWAVMTELCGPEVTEAQLVERFRLASEIARDGVDGAVETIAETFGEAFAEARSASGTDKCGDTDIEGAEPE
jgi:hypothetical protein